jgi:hypothetical protein
MFQIARFLAVSAIAIGVPMIAHAQDERLSILSAEMSKLVEKKQDLIKIDRWTSEHAQTYQRVNLDLEALSREIERLKTSKSYPITKTANNAGPQLAKAALPSTPSKSTTPTSAIWEDK